MGLIRVTSNELRSTASQLRDLNTRLQAEAERFMEGATALGATWEGDTKQAFMNATSRDKQQMDNFVGLIERYVITIEEIARKYDAAESENTQIATSRAY